MLALRPNLDTIQIWNKNAKDQEKVNMIKEDLDKFIKLEGDMRWEYEIFSEIVSNQQEKEKEVKPEFYREQNVSNRGRGRGYRGRGAPHKAGETS